MLGDARTTARQIVSRHRSGQGSCTQTVERVLASLPAVQDNCNPFTQWFADEALENARLLDEELQSGKPTRCLHGVPVCIKDMTPSKGHNTTLGSWSSGDGHTDFDAQIVKRLKGAGAIIVGKTTTAELAFSSFTNTPRYGVTRNPWDLSRTSGGSSGGSAVAVATGLVPLAEGTDMGGSVRIPAAACGIVGFKPSLGRIPMDIVPSGLETYSHFGCLAASVDDAVLFMQAAAGFHPDDMLSSAVSFDAARCKPRALEGVRMALCVDLGFCVVDREIEDRLRSFAEQLAVVGVEIEEVRLPWTKEIFESWTVRWNCLMALYPNTHSEAEKRKMGPELVSAIEQGRKTTAMDLLRVDVLRREMNAQLNEVFASHDALLCPTIAVPAPLTEQSDADFEGVMEDGRVRVFDMTHPFNMVPTSPAISLPIGLTSDGLPIGAQIAGPPRRDEETLSLAAAIEAMLEPLPLPQIAA